MLVQGTLTPVSKRKQCIARLVKTKLRGSVRIEFGYHICLMTLFLFTVWTVEKR